MLDKLGKPTPAGVAAGVAAGSAAFSPAGGAGSAYATESGTMLVWLAQMADLTGYHDQQT